MTSDQIDIKSERENLYMHYPTYVIVHAFVFHLSSNKDRRKTTRITKIKIKNKKNNHDGYGNSLPEGHGAMGRRIDPSWSGPIELFLVPASAPRLM